MLNFGEVCIADYLSELCRRIGAGEDCLSGARRNRCKFAWHLFAASGREQRERTRRSEFRSRHLEYPDVQRG